MKKYFLIFFLFVFSLTAEIPLNQSHFLHIVVPTYNNEKTIQKTLNSLLDQKNINFKITILNDGSVDKTLPYIQKLIKEKNKENLCEVISYAEHLGLLERSYSYIHSLPDQEIVVLIDEKASLKHPLILSLIGEKFQNKNTWFLYGQYTHPNGSKGKCALISPKNLIFHSSRKKFWHYAPIKAFYVSLFKKIAINDFFYKGKFFSMYYDASYVFPLSEMASSHTHFIQEPLCWYKPLFSQEAHRPSDWCYIKTIREIRNRSPYEKISNPFHQKIYPQKADLVIFSYHRPLQLFAQLESIKTHVKNLDTVSVIFRADNEKYEKAYEVLQKEFPHVHFLAQGKNPHKDFKKLTIKALSSSNPHILFAVDDLIFKDDVDLSECIEALENTKAFFFSLRLGEHLNTNYMVNKDQKLPHRIEYPHQMIAWQIKNSEYDWCYPTSVDVTLYRKKDIMPFFYNMDYIHPNSLEQMWYKEDDKRNDRKRIGLAYKTSKALNLAINQVHISEDRFAQNAPTCEELLEEFLKGQKIDISYFHLMLNQSAHMESGLPLIKR